MRILIAEDEAALARALVKIFEKNNFSADAVDNGKDVLLYLDAGNYDACVMDIMMPCMDGLSALRELRARGHQLPVLLLSAKGEIEDRVTGLDSGANDYLPKPFDTRELLARVRAMTRPAAAVDSRLTLGNITLDRSTYELFTPSGRFRLANKEYQMLELLLQNPGHLISTTRFMEKIWGYDSEAELSVVWVYISYLRKKLVALRANVEIRATRNLGYSLEIKT